MPELHLALAKIYRDSNRKKEAATELRTLLRKNPEMKDRAKIEALIAQLEGR